MSPGKDVGGKLAAPQDVRNTSCKIVYEKDASHVNLYVEVGKVAPLLIRFSLNVLDPRKTRDLRNPAKALEEGIGDIFNLERRDTHLGAWQ